MEIIKYPDPILRRQADVVELFDQELKDVTHQMLDMMYNNQGVGLAGPQVGISKRFFVCNPSGKRDKAEQELIIINPKVLESSGGEFGEEGCLSVPGIYGEVERASQIRLQWQDLEGNTMEKIFMDFDARVIQHEMDHLQGILFVQRLEPADKMRIKKALIKMGKK